MSELVHFCFYSNKIVWTNTIFWRFDSVDAIINQLREQQIPLNREMAIFLTIILQIIGLDFTRRKQQMF